VNGSKRKTGTPSRAMIGRQSGRDTGEARRYRDQTSAYAPSACRRARVAS